MTANDLIRRALLSIGAIGETDTPSPEQEADTFASINQFLSSLGSEGFVTWQYTNPTDDIGLDDGYELMIQTNVAVMIAPDYGKEASATIQRIASSTRRTLKRATTIVPRARLDPRVWQLQSDRCGYDICTDSYGGAVYYSPPPPLAVLPPAAPVPAPAPPAAPTGPPPVTYP